jgi:NADH dehydrogenase/NADH:ubiquinone oxidoreductase subunit G
MKKKGNRLTDMEFDEVSLVTRPANQLSKVVLFKSDEPSEDDVADNNDDNLEVNDDASADTIDKGYGKSKKKMPMLDEDVEEDMEEDDMEEEMPMKKKGMKMKKEDDVASDEIEIPQEIYDYIEALETANGELVDQINKMIGEDDAAIAEEQEEILKSADPRLVEIVKGLEERAAAAEAIAKAERDHRLEQEYISKAEELDNLSVDAEKFGVVLKNMAAAMNSEDYDAVWQILTSANANLSNAGMFHEIGKSTNSDANGTMSVIEKAAAAIRQANPSLTREQSIAKAVEADSNLYNQYIREGK